MQGSKAKVGEAEAPNTSILPTTSTLVPNCHGSSCCTCHGVHKTNIDTEHEGDTLQHALVAVPTRTCEGPCPLQHAIDISGQKDTILLL